MRCACDSHIKLLTAAGTCTLYYKVDIPGYTQIILCSCEIKSGRGRPGFEAIIETWNGSMTLYMEQLEQGIQRGYVVFYTARHLCKVHHRAKSVALG